MRGEKGGRFHRPIHIYKGPMAKENTVLLRTETSKDVAQRLDNAGLVFKPE